MPFTTKQRDAIRDRDRQRQTIPFPLMGNQTVEQYIDKFETYIRLRDAVYGKLTCMFPHEKNDPCSGALRPHYIRPLFWAEQRKLPLDTILHKFNVLTMCEKASDRIDPGFAAMIAHASNREVGMRQLQTKRLNRARQGIPYWNASWDPQLKIIARHVSTITKPGLFIPEGQMRCQFPHWYKGSDMVTIPCNGHVPKKNLVPTVEVHHIKPQGWAIAHNVGLTEVDDPFIALTICVNAHHMGVHPDMLDALADYHPDKTSFQRVFDERKQDLALGLKYWNPQRDDVLLIIAEHQTRIALKNGWEFPSRTQQKTPLVEMHEILSLEILPLLPNEVSA